MTRTQRQIEEYRKGEACIQVVDEDGRPCPDVPVWVEQESHAFVFGCVAPDLAGVAEPDRQRCGDRLNEVFNRLLHGSEAAVPGATRVPIPNDVRLGRFRSDLDRLASGGTPLAVYVTGQCVGLRLHATAVQERAAAERVAELYTLCFAHPAVHTIVWSGFWDGEQYADGGGLLRLDFAPKPAFRYLHKLIDTIWHTRADGETDADGRFRFRGFFGAYRVAAMSDVTTTALYSFRRGSEPLFVLPICTFL